MKKQELIGAHPLARIVLRQIGGMSALREVAKHGRGDAGWPGFTSYADTVSFASRNKRAILRHLNEAAADLNMNSVSLVQGFPCLRGLDLDSAAVVDVFCDLGDDEDDKYTTEILNALSWYALESVAALLAAE